MRAALHRGVKFDLKAEGIGELQRAALERRLRERAGDAVFREKGRRLVEIAFVADLESQPVAGRDLRLAQHQRVMLMLLAAAQIYRVRVTILDMEANGVFVKLAARVQVGHIEHGMAAPDDVEGRIEDVLRNGHQVSLLNSSFRGDAWHRTRNLEIPGSPFGRPGMTAGLT